MALEHDAHWFVDQLAMMKNNTHYHAWVTMFKLSITTPEHHIITAKLKAFRAAWDAASPELQDDVCTRLVLERHR